MKTAKEIEEERLKKLDAKPKEEKTVKEHKRDVLHDFLNKKVRIILLNNDYLEGVLKRFSNYELVLEVAEKSKIVVWKHACMSITEV